MCGGRADWRDCSPRFGTKRARHAIKARCACVSGRIAMDRPRFGYLRVQVMLRREGWPVGKKRVYRLYRLEGLQLRMKVKRLLSASVCFGANLLRLRDQTSTGAKDFVHDQMPGGRAFRVLTVVRAVESPEVCL